MDRTITIAVAAPIPHGHRIEVVERVDDSGSRAVVELTDLETRVRYRQEGHPTSDASTWTGRVIECVIARSRVGVKTMLLVDPTGPGSAEADVALRGADAAAGAASVEALRWGGGDTVPEPEPPRFW
ncbi:hypothetical protein [Microbacterium murale]|uniref:Uncharacterized protein n=1 Tax=Microbacterium murale TaxID=1081040 RepID=A0ABQ1S028_9MICO|nr:hypothetical protein [Microbacterium murale]GGD85936.1 hypothetical protein GCM10007269_31100 [Microbacterium murale]